MTTETANPTTVLDADRCWTAVAARDKGADGTFFYAVKRSGVYCRPSCPARLPRRDNVSFHASVEAAESAGFRACLRCRPRALAGSDPAAAVMTDLSRYIEAHADEELPLKALAARAGFSTYHLLRAFKAIVGVTPKAFQTAARLNRLKSSLRAGDGVAGAIFEAGFGSTSRAYERIDGHFGMTPSAYRAGGRGETIAHACRQTTLGWIMMAATERGVCFVQFGDGEAALLEQLRTEFPNAALEASNSMNSPQLDDWIEALDRHLSDGAPHPDVPLDLRGTAFQIRVWRFLLSVPSGEVVSYAEVAKGIDAPKAVRAAASACAANRIAVLVPCHRVLRGDGGLGGYRWGAERKRVLVGAERQRRTAA